MLSQNPIKSNW